jgi:hypothetical protein
MEKNWIYNIRLVAKRYLQANKTKNDKDNIDPITVLLFLTVWLFSQTAKKLRIDNHKGKVTKK